MQDITDESEHDLQSVFNKISESLKTINQETLEAQSSQNISAEQFSEKETEALNSCSTGIEIEQPLVLTHIPDKIIEDVCDDAIESSGIVKLVQETALEITNLLNEKAIGIPQKNFDESDGKNSNSNESCLDNKSTIENEHESKSSNNKPVQKSVEENCNFDKIDFKAKEGDSIQEEQTEIISETEKRNTTLANFFQEELEAESSHKIANEEECSSNKTEKQEDISVDNSDKEECPSNKTETQRETSVHNSDKEEDTQCDSSNLPIATEENKILLEHSFDKIEKINSLHSLKAENDLNTEITQIETNKNVENSLQIKKIEHENIDSVEKYDPDNEKCEEKEEESLLSTSNQVEKENLLQKDLETLEPEEYGLDIDQDKTLELEKFHLEKTSKDLESVDKDDSKKENEECEDNDVELFEKLEKDKLSKNQEETIASPKAEIEKLEISDKKENLIEREGLSLEKDMEKLDTQQKINTANNEKESEIEKCNVEVETKSVEKKNELENSGAGKELLSNENKIEIKDSVEKERKDSLSNKEEEKIEPNKNATVESVVISLDDSDEENTVDKSINRTELSTENKIVENEKIEPMVVDVEKEKSENKINTGEMGKSAKEIGDDEKTDANIIDSPNSKLKNTTDSNVVIDLDDEDSNDKYSKNVEESETINTSENGKKQDNTEFDKEIEKTVDSVKQNKEYGDKLMDEIRSTENNDDKSKNLENKSKNEDGNLEKDKNKSEKDVEVMQIDLEILEKPEKSMEKYTFYNKECVNFECKKSCLLYYLAPIFVLNFYKVTIKQNLSQYVCDECYEAVVNKYEEWCNLLETHQPLLLTKVPQKTNEFVEILDSSDEEDGDGKKGDEKSNDFNEETIDMIEKELDDVISTVLSRTEIQNQLTWSKSLLEHRITKLKEDSDWMQETLSTLQKNADKMNNALYQCPKIEMKILAPLDLNSGKTYVLGESTLANQLTIPPIGEIYRPPIVLGGEYYAAKSKVIASWLPSTVVELVDPPANEKQKNLKYYKVKFFKLKVPTCRSVPAKHLAFGDVPKVQLSIGTRVIALFDASTLYKTKECHGSDIKSAFYPGVVAEALQPYNNYRYLIFFDDGYTQYVQHRDVRLICEVSANVWDDIHPGSRDFIQNYLINYKKNRPMVQVRKGQSMVTELNGKWIYAKVVDVDASLIQMLFEGQKNHTEWIYRGSTRLGPLFKAIQKTNIPQVSRLPRRSEPFVRYMQDDENVKQQQSQQNEPGQSTPQVRSQVARKSTARQESQDPPTPTAAVKHLNNSTIFVDDEEPKGTLIYYSSKSENNPPPKPFKPHMCGPHCIIREHFEGQYGVLSKPLLNSWERSIYKIKSKKTSVVYRTPCGRNLRSIGEVHKYLRLTRNELNVENFVFDPEVGCLNEYQVKKCIVNKADITEGREKIPIQCVNYYDHTMPPDCEYSADRIPTEGVNLNVDPEFLVGCDCKEDCTDKSKCSCWQLTLQGARYGNPHTPLENIGYYYKRLLEPVTTGIYECNSRCKCSSKCINRVVQHPLETKLQVFKTSNRGWGLRCINDVPRGAFICIYAGNLLTEQRANECGDGDEYFAELDYIEVAERLKEGYESDAQEDIDSDEYVPEHDSDEEFNPRSEKASAPLVSTRNRTATAKRSNSSTTNGTNDDDDEQERQAINFVPNTQLENYEEITTKYKSMRRLFGKNEFCYIMDAKSIGNVGRYFNHSCSPNLFVQNVFVDTHDLRFPWVAFFALSNIRAGTELTWNYNYEVGVVPGKVLFCQCGAANCRGRLL